MKTWDRRYFDHASQMGALVLAVILRELGICVSLLSSVFHLASDRSMALPHFSK